jgi:hypothetical protein
MPIPASSLLRLERERINGVRTDRKPRANNYLLVVKRGLQRRYGRGMVLLANVGGVSAEDFPEAETPCHC